MKHRIYNAAIGLYERNGADHISELIEDRCFAAINHSDRKITIVFTAEKPGFSEPEPTMQEAESIATQFLVGFPDFVNCAIQFDFATVQITGDDRALLKLHKNFVHASKTDARIDKIVEQIEKYGNKKVKELVGKLREVL